MNNEMSYPKQPCCLSAVVVTSLRLKLIQTENWWHKEWHQATGIPCDGSKEYCPLARKQASESPTGQKSLAKEDFIR